MNRGTKPVNRKICHTSCHHQVLDLHACPRIGFCFIEGSLHYTPEHCLANGGFPVFWWKKPCFKWAKWRSFEEPCSFCARKADVEDAGVVEHLQRVRCIAREALKRVAGVDLRCARSKVPTPNLANPTSRTATWMSDQVWKGYHGEKTQG